MAATRSVLDVSTNRHIKYSQAVALIEQHHRYAWLEHGSSMRRLTLAESIQAKAEAARNAGLQPVKRQIAETDLRAELPSCKYMPAERNQEQHRRGLMLAASANAVLPHPKDCKCPRCVPHEADCLCRWCTKAKLRLVREANQMCA